MKNNITDKLIESQIEKLTTRNNKSQKQHIIHSENNVKKKIEEYEKKVFKSYKNKSNTCKKVEKIRKKEKKYELFGIVKCSTSQLYQGVKFKTEEKIKKIKKLSSKIDQHIPPSYNKYHASRNTISEPSRILCRR